MCNYFRQGWVVSRLKSALSDVFGREPLVMQLPYIDEIPEQNLRAPSRCLMAGDTSRIEEAFARHPAYWLRTARRKRKWRIRPTDSRKFRLAGEKETWTPFRPARVAEASEAQYPPTDDWPFLYLHWPMIPDLTLRGMAIMGGIALVLLLGAFAGSEQSAPAARCWAPGCSSSVPGSC